MATISRILGQRASLNPFGKAITLHQRGKADLALSNAEFFRDVLRASSSLSARGLRRGDILLIALGHQYELPLAFCSALYLGAIPCVSPYPDSYGNFLKNTLQLSDHSQAAMLLISREQKDRLNQPRRGVQILDPGVLWEGDAAQFLAPVLHGMDEPVFLQYSSGTTGEPKGILIKQQALIASLGAMQRAMGLTESDVTISWAPFYHEMGLVLGFLLPLYTGGCTSLISPFHWVQFPQILFETITQQKGTVAWMPNFGFDLSVRRLSDYPVENFDLSTLRFLGNGSEPVQKQTLERFVDRFQGAGFSREKILTGYGLAENVVLATASRPGVPPSVDYISAEALHKDRVARPVSSEDPSATSFMSCGSAIPGQEIQIRGEKNSLLREREIGEVVIRSATLFSGYFRRTTLEKSSDGWFRTGDIGYISAGELFICGRIKDLIIIGGRNIYPDSVEVIAQTVLAEKGARAVAFGLPSEELGTEEIVLICESRSSLPDSEKASIERQIRAELLHTIGVSLADFGVVPKGWIEKSSSGKLARARNRDKYLRECSGLAPTSSGGSSPPTVQESAAPGPRKGRKIDLVIEIFKQTLDLDSVLPDDDFFELGGDSLGFARCVIALEREVGLCLEDSVSEIEEMTPRVLVERLEELGRPGSDRAHEY